MPVTEAWLARLDLAAARKEIVRLTGNYDKLAHDYDTATANLAAEQAKVARLTAERDAAHAKLLQIYRYALTKQEETAFDELCSAMWDIRQIAMHGDAR